MIGLITSSSDLEVQIIAFKERFGVLLSIPYYERAEPATQARIRNYVKRFDQRPSSFTILYGARPNARTLSDLYGLSLADLDEGLRIDAHERRLPNVAPLFCSKDAFGIFKTKNQQGVRVTRVICLANPDESAMAEGMEFTAVLMLAGSVPGIMRQFALWGWEVNP
jgi:hypothetical protein